MRSHIIRIKSINNDEKCDKNENSSRRFFWNEKEKKKLSSRHLLINHFRVSPASPLTCEKILSKNVIFTLSNTHRDHAYYFPK